MEARGGRGTEGCDEWGCGGCGNLYDRPLAGSAEREVAASEAAADAARQRQEVENADDRLMTLAQATSNGHLTPPSAGHSGWPRKSRRRQAERAGEWSGVE